MIIIRKGTFTVRTLDTDHEHKCTSLNEAQLVAATIVGNQSYARPFASEHTYLYGPGDGTVTVTIMEDIDFA